MRYGANTSGPRAIRFLRLSAALALACVAVLSITVAASPNASRAVALSGPPCSSATAQTLASVDGMVAERIYRDELVGPATIEKQHQVEQYGPLLSALSEGNRTAVRKAVTALVYSGTHIVRLRVSQEGSLLADVGGPYIIAPVGGELRLQGRLVGSYLLSVQDDLGFVGLERRLIGDPLVLHVNRARVPLTVTLRTGSVAIPNRGAVVIQGRSFQAYSFTAKAYPTGALRISLLLPVGHGSASSCAEVGIAEVGRIARLIWGRWVADGTPFAGFVNFAESHTGALIYVRAGSHQLAGSTQPGPSRLPESGEITYGGVIYGVTSFATRMSSGPVRIYQLVRP
jgi:hypothetical protein